MQKFVKLFWVCLISLMISYPANSQNKSEREIAIKKAQQYINEIAQESFPEINLKRVKLKTFQSNKVFFKARFSFTKYLTFQKMQHLVYVNPKVFTANAPETGVRSILAHELSHVLYYLERNRFELLGLTRLASSGFSRSFERRADLEAIKRGYGKGLIEYRKWLYRIVPAKQLKSKKRNYFSPDEIALILEISKNKPEMFKVWRKKVPKNIDEIKKSIE